MGTAAYMSPEQAAGQSVDKRGDIWSFGVVLFEALTGQRLFTGETVSHVLGAVLRLEPDWSTLPPLTPEPLRKLLRRCLHKERKRRLRDIGDALVDLDEALTAPSSAEATIAPVTQPGDWRRALPWVAGIVLAMIAGFGGWTLRPQQSQPVSRFAVSVSPSAPVLLSNRHHDVAMSLDGTRVVYRVAGDGFSQLYVRALDQLEGVPLRGAERAENPFISPGGVWVGFMAEGVIQKVSILGGPPVTICELPNDLRGASWGLDDTIVFGTASDGGLMQVSGAGGEPEPISTADESSRHVWPDILPGGAGVLFMIDRGAGLGMEDIAVLNVDTGEYHVIIPGGNYPKYSPTGHIVYEVEGTLRAVTFDLNTLEVTSDPVPVLEDVFTARNGATAFDLSGTGSLVYVSATGIAERWCGSTGRDARNRSVRSRAYIKGSDSRPMASGRPSSRSIVKAMRTC